jgi:hypothetical protein
VFSIIALEILFASFLIGELNDLSCSVSGFLAESSVIYTFFSVMFLLDNLLFNSYKLFDLVIDYYEIYSVFEG